MAAGASDHAQPISTTTGERVPARANDRRIRRRTARRPDTAPPAAGTCKSRGLNKAPSTRAERRNDDFMKSGHDHGPVCATPAYRGRWVIIGPAPVSRRCLYDEILVTCPGGVATLTRRGTPTLLERRAASEQASVRPGPPCARFVRVCPSRRWGRATQPKPRGSRPSTSTGDR